MASSITRREFAQLVAGAGVALAVARVRAASDGGGNAWKGYRDAMVIDACGGPGDPDENDPLAPLSAKAVADARASGITAACVTFALPAVGFEETAKGLAAVEREIDAHPDTFVKVKHGADLLSAKASGRVGIIYALQDLSFVGNDFTKLDAVARLGLRVAQPTYNLRTVYGDGCLEPGNAGLSKLGRALLERLRALGIVVDLSHCGQQTTADAIAASPGPVAITHTGCAAVHDHPRNKRDEELRACAGRGGVVGIYCMPFLRPRGQPTAEDVIRHVEHALNVCGEDHVGIGTDNTISPSIVTEKFKAAFREFVRRRKAAGVAAPGEDEQTYLFAKDLNTPQRLETLAGMLLQRGHPESRVRKVLGGNFARLFSAVWG